MQTVRIEAYYRQKLLLKSFVGFLKVLEKTRELKHKTSESSSHLTETNGKNLSTVIATA